MKWSIVYYTYLSSLVSTALSSFTPCPILGPAYPQFNVNTNDTAIFKALNELTDSFDELTTKFDGPNGPISPRTSFSIAVFSTNKGNAADNPAFWQYHYTSKKLKGNSSEDSSLDVDENSIYRIGGLTEAFTVWSLLLSQGEHIWNDSILKYLPELANESSLTHEKMNPIKYPQWDEITVGQLATHMSGLARDYCIHDLTTETGFSKAGFPSKSGYRQPCCGDKAQCSNIDYITNLTSRVPVTAAGATPIYSNLGFQIMGYMLEKQTKSSFAELVQNRILARLSMNATSIFAPKDSSLGIIPVSKEASGWSSRNVGDKSSKSMFSSARDLAIAGKAILSSDLLSPAETRRWLKPFAQTSNPKNSVGAPWTIYSGGSYPDTSMVPVYTLLSNEGEDEGLYSSYLGLVPDYGIGYAILSADTESPADLNAHADYMQAILDGVVTTATSQAVANFGGPYAAEKGNSSISIKYDQNDTLPGLWIDEFVSNGVNFKKTLADILGMDNGTVLSIRLYPTQRTEEDCHCKASKQVFRGVMQDKTELADAETPTCVSWQGVDKLQYNGHGLDEFVFTVDEAGSALSVEIPALNVTLARVEE
ncbi:hypothetical protein N7478_001192 [Penicillium angulare]|uniref:uncharacterized protein n=1 Tax=Penicillium angulare TaxID=116970 RepID=UPI0025400EAE|nr:uncharacterized protein N7478_001192 [Penicillium angulare]KAJ5291941.1 hypothetical protein N7478_001192 [Penicillium angulare]